MSFKISYIQKRVQFYHLIVICGTVYLDQTAIGWSNLTQTLPGKNPNAMVLCMLLSKRLLNRIIRPAHASEITYKRYDSTMNTATHHKTDCGHVWKSLTVRGHELADGWRGSGAALHEHHLRDDDVVLEHGAAAHTHGVTASLVHVHFRPTAILTPPHGGGVAVTSDGERNGDDADDLFKQNKKIIMLQ